MERNRNLLTAGLTLAIAVGTLSGCATAPAKVATPAQPAPAAAQQPAPDQKVEAALPKPVLAGKVVETMDGGGYTYLLVEKDGKKTWTAIPATEVKVGQEVILTPGIDMVNFRSSALKRTFDYIHFSSGIQGDEAKMPHPVKKEAAAAAPAAPAADPAALPPGHPALPKGDAAKAAAPAPAAAAEPITGTVVEALEAGGYTYLNVEKDGKKTWAAIPQAEVKVGSKVAVQPGAVMPSFTSKSLKRTFENIIFSPGLAQ